MDEVTMWGGFLGAWLLVAGPMYQASLELGAEDAAIEEFRAARGRVPPPPPVSPWWWLVPPVHIVLSRRRRHAFRQQTIDAMDPEQFATVDRFIDKATGWLFVATGGFLLALRMTYDVVTGESWSLIVALALAALMTFLSLANVAARQAHSARSIVEHAERHRLAGATEDQPTEGRPTEGRSTEGRSTGGSDEGNGSDGGTGEPAAAEQDPTTRS